MPRRIRLFVLPVVVPVWIALILAGWAITPHPMMRLFPQSAQPLSLPGASFTGFAVVPLPMPPARPAVERPHPPQIANSDLRPARPTGGSGPGKATRTVLRLADTWSTRPEKPAGIAGGAKSDRPQSKTNTSHGQIVRASATTPTGPDRPHGSDVRDVAQGHGPDDRKGPTRRPDAAEPG